MSHNKYKYKYEGCQLKKSDKRYKKYAAQRKNRGWDDTVTWNLDQALAKLIAPRLERFIELHHGYPSIGQKDEYDANLNKMLAAFKFLASDDCYDIEMCRQNDAMVEEGLNLFAKHYRTLWS